MADDAPDTFEQRFTAGTEGPPSPPPPDNTVSPENTFVSSEYAKKYAAEQLKQGLANPAQEYKLFKGAAAGIEAMIAATPEGIHSLFSTAEKAFFKGVTPQEEISEGVNAALTQIGSGIEFKPPPGVVSSFDAFHNQVTIPALKKLSVPDDQPEPIHNSTVPSGAARSQLALTGEPHVDAILTSPVTKGVIDNPVIDRTHDVPYTAGGSVPLADPTMFIDKNFPRAFNIDGKVFDPAEPFAIHENVEQRTMDLLTKGGMDDATAYKVAHFEFAEKAEGAWYDAHGIDKATAEKAYAPYMAAIQHDRVDVFRGSGGGPAPNPEEAGATFYTPNRKLAENYGAVTQHSVDLSNSRSFDVDELVKDPQFQQEMRASMERYARRGGNEPNPQALENRWQQVLNKINNPTERNNDLGHMRFDSSITGAIIARAKAQGADVAVIKNMAEGHGKPSDQIIVLNKKALDSENFPPNLYKRPYPHDEPSAAANEAIAEPRPTRAEIDRAKGIIADWQAKGETEPLPEAVKPKPNPLVEARSLGVIGPNRPDILRMAPREAAARATQDVLRSPPPGQPSAWRQRWEQTLDKMQTPADARGVISSIVDANDEFAQARQGNLTAGQVEQLGLVTGLDSAKIDAAGTSAKIKNDVEIRNTIEAFTSINQKIADAARGLRDKHGAGDEAELAKMVQLELQRDLLLNATTASKEFAALRAEFGRTGNLIQDYMSAVKETNGLKDFLREKQGEGIDDVRDRARMIADTPPEALPRAIQASRVPHKQGWAFWAWQQAIISGVVTHTKYFVVNTATTALERVIAPEVAAAIGKMRGEKTSLMAPIWANVGMIRGLPEAVRGFGQAFKSGIRVPLETEIELEKRDLPNPQAAGAKTPFSSPGPEWGFWKNVFNETQLSTAEKVLGAPGRSANAIHTFYKILNERASLTSQAYEQAFKEGLDGQKFWNRYRDLVSNPTDEMLTGATTDAYTGSFMAKLGKETGAWARALQQNRVMRWFFPFQHIPWNIMKMSVEYSPFAAFGPEMRGALMGKKGAPAQNLAWAKVAVGSSIMTYLMNKAMTGDATGDYPTNPKDRERWRLLNLQPNSVRVGDEWQSMERFGPAGNVAKFGADLGWIVHNYNGQDDDALTKAVWGAGMAAVNLVADETGFQTLRNLIDSFEDENKATRFVAWQAGSFMPFSSMVSQFASMADPEMRQAKSFIDGLKYRIPSARETLLPKRDALYGEPVANPGYGTFFRASPVDKDPVKAELDRIGYYPAAPRAVIGGVKLTPQQYDKYEATAGPLVKQALSSLVSSPPWRVNGPQWQKQVAKEIIAAARQRAAAAMQIDDPSLIQQGIANRK